MTQLETELRDAWQGEGNASRIPFRKWVRAMAEDDKGTLQEAARRFLNAPTQHTAGPWHYSSGMVWAGGPEQVAIARAARDEDATAPTERDANARLIAAAPELLDACKDALERIDAYGGALKFPLTAAKLRAALAKATGAASEGA